MDIGVTLIPGMYYKVWWYNHRYPVSCEWTGSNFRIAREGQKIHDEVDWTKDPELIGSRRAYEDYVKACELSA